MKNASNSMRSDDRDLDSDTIIALFEHLYDVPEWMTDGECVRRDIQPDDTKAVLAACKVCPVIRTCAEFAKDMSITTGVYGGENLSERGLEK